MSEAHVIPPSAQRDTVKGLSEASLYFVERSAISLTPGTTPLQTLTALDTFYPSAGADSRNRNHQTEQTTKPHFRLRIPVPAPATGTHRNDSRHHSLI